MRSLWGVVKTSSVGMFGTWRWPHTVSVAAARPARALEQADGEVRAGAAEPDRVEAALVERRGPRGEAGGVLRPGGDRVGLVEAHRAGDRVPEPLDVGLAEDRARPALGRAGDDRPGDAALRDEPQRGLDELGHPGGADPPPVEIGEELGLGVAGHGDARALRSPVASRRVSSQCGVKSSASSGPDATSACLTCSST